MRERRRYRTTHNASFVFSFFVSLFVAYFRVVYGFCVSFGNEPRFLTFGARNFVSRQLVVRTFRQTDINLPVTPARRIARQDKHWYAEMRQKERILEGIRILPEDAQPRSGGCSHQRDIVGYGSIMLRGQNSCIAFFIFFIVKHHVKEDY